VPLTPPVDTTRLCNRSAPGRGSSRVVERARNQQEGSGGDPRTAEVERSPLLGRCRGSIPQEVSRQADVLPAQRCCVAQQRVGHHLACRALMRDGVGDVGGVPVDNGGDDEVQPRRPKLLRLGATVRDPALLEGADDLGEGMMLLALGFPPGGSVR
jgi:hypothetical protein